MTELVIIAVVVFAFAMVSQRLSLSPVTAPMVFTAVGILLGTAGAQWFHLDLKSDVVSILVEATLVLVLFTDAVRIDLRALRKQVLLPLRLLGIGLPLTIVLGAVAAAALFDQLTFIEAALIAAILAPTDAALGQAVVSDKRLPVRIRQALNVESGLNDGIMVPVVTVFLAVAAAETGVASSESWGVFAAQQIGFGILMGGAVGAIGGWLLSRASSAGQVDGIYRQLATIAIAVAAYAGAGVVGGNGFIAAFVAGLAFSAVARDHCKDVQDFTEDEGELLGSITFLVFGAVLAAPILTSLTWQIALYVVLSLTVVRMVPVLISMAWSGTRFETRLFIGWFGPRGLASILFALLVFDELSGSVADTVFSVAVWTILVSVFAHGATASPWTAQLARHLSSAPASAAELKHVQEMPARRRF
ncbi:sodium:proton antiporter [Salinibacterium sp. NK8237]|uniref:cation:proton antiporter n=1 Tax=Salinibacterium sp. NK8237 TaxID=2792038 RepID=UPI0018CD1E2A|nr:cation:proton antiporter [Salinibacterium sp. NK8237]MBH0129296.1 cation:proton antiporter [Salinibacterium sp. NK8237]